MNLGARPTFTSNGTDSLEVHILDFDADLYGHCSLLRTPASVSSTSSAARRTLR